MKVTFYIAWFLCFAKLSLILFSPFGGLMNIPMGIKRGLYGEKYIRTLFENKKLIDNFLLFDNMIAAIYFGILILCSILPLLYKLDPRTKYKTGIICALIAICIVMLPKLLGLIF